MPQLRNNEAAHRYEITEGEQVLGFAEYVQTGKLLTLPHTQVDKGHAGEGLGSQLARYALDDAQARGLQVAPSCPFIAAYLRKHPQYLALVPPQQRHLLSE